MGCLVPDPLRTAAYASRTTLGGVFPERLQPLVQATADLAERFRSAGHTLYLVGDRCATPSWLTKAPPTGRRDLDFTTDARPDAIEAIVTGWADAVWTQGKRFGTIGFLRVGRSTRSPPIGRGLPARLPQTRGGLRERRGMDLARRDFTINAMALRLPNSS